MRALLRRCAACGRYTLSKAACPACGGPVRVPHPPKYSPEDRYQLYRIRYKASLGLIKAREETLRRLLSA